METKTETYYVIRKPGGNFLSRDDNTSAATIFDARRFKDTAEVEAALAPILKNPIYRRADYETLQVEAQFVLSPLVEPPTNGVVSELSREVVTTRWGPRSV